MPAPNESNFGLILYSVLLKAREIGERSPGSDEAFAAYQVIDTALQEAEVWGVSPTDLGLDGFDPQTLLKAKRAIVP